MVQFIHLRSVIKNCSVFKVLTPAVLALLLWGICESVFNLSLQIAGIDKSGNGNLNLLIYFSFIGCFYLIALEDYKTCYVDIRKCGILFIFALIMQEEYLPFLFSVFMGWLLFLTVFLVQLKYVILQVHNEPEIEDSNTYKSFIPSLWLGMILSCSFIPEDFLNKFNLNLSSTDWFNLLQYITSYYATAVASILAIWVICLAFIIKRHYKKINSGYEALSGFGAGDAILLPIFIGVLGWHKFFIVFFISNIIHIVLGHISKHIKI